MGALRRRSTYIVVSNQRTASLAGGAHTQHSAMAKAAEGEVAATGTAAEGGAAADNGASTSGREDKGENASCRAGAGSGT